MRHRFAVNTLLRWYRDGVDVERHIPRLATWLGHAHVSDTYWYLLLVAVQTGLRASELILLAPIPVHQCAGGEPMSEVMQTWSVAVVLATQADLARQRVEGTVDLRTVKPVPPTNPQMGALTRRNTRRLLLNGRPWRR